MVYCADSKGTPVAVAIVDDCEPNKGGFYCEVYIKYITPLGCPYWAEDRIDDFCIHTTDCDCTNNESVENYIKNFISRQDY